MVQIIVDVPIQPLSKLKYGCIKDAILKLNSKTRSGVDDTKKRQRLSSFLAGLMNDV